MNVKWACLACRVTYSRDHRQCPRCGNTVYRAGKYFKPPRRNATRQWRVVEILIRGGVTFDKHLTHLVTTILDQFIESPDGMTRTDLESALREVEWALKYFEPPVAIHDHAVPTTPRAAEEYLAWVDAERQRYQAIRQQLMERLG